MSKIPIGPVGKSPANAPSSVDTSGGVAEIALSGVTVWRECSGGQRTNGRVKFPNKMKKCGASKTHLPIEAMNTIEFVLDKTAALRL